MTPDQKVRRPGLAVAAMTFACWTCLGGCGGGPVPTYPVTGRVVFADKQPLPGGNIEFAPQVGTVKTSARAMIEEDGTFNLTTFQNGDGAIEGTHRVLIIPARRRGDQPGRTARSIDDKYQSFETSGLEAKVSPDSENYFEFTVSSPGGNR